ncbi:MAG TPA: hypothetical protein VFK05_31485 [Polyangiaceae bacterium]|nr:hypothetical protein [Polyangiaceae bacterium]
MNIQRGILLSCALVAAIGCGAGTVPWRVMSQANPNPVVGQKQFVVAPVDFSTLTVGAKSEAEYLSKKSPEDRQGWEHAKAAFQEEFDKAIRASGTQAGLNITLGASGAPFVIKPKVDYIEPGYYAYVSSSASGVKVTMKIVTAEGKDVDEVLLEHHTSASMGSASVESRVRADGEGMGAQAAQYIAQRVAPKG